jgi:hypothetical protein
MQPPKSSICVICGNHPATTVEHVPPRGFFKGVEGQFLTVPACFACNNGSSADDELLRNYISLQIGTQTAGSRQLWEKGAHKSLLRSPKIRSQLLSTLHQTGVINKNGLATTRLAFTVPVDLYQRVFERTTRGLYFLHTGKILLADTPVQIKLLTVTPELPTPDLKNLEKHSIAGGVFEYRFGLDGETASNSVWVFTIYGSHWVESLTGQLVENNRIT